jgi:hypothetical protein
LAITVSLAATMLLKNVGDVYNNETLRCIWVTIAAVEKQ